MSSRLAAWLQWGARLLGLPPVIFVVAHLTAEGFPNLGAGPPHEAALFACLIAAVAGLVVLWRWPVVGGSLTVGAIAAFYAVHAATVERLPGGPWFLLIGGVGALALLSAWLHRRDGRHPGIPSGGASATL